MPETGYCNTDEGQVFWRYDSPVYGKGSVQKEASQRPTLLFIHAGVSNHTLWDDQVAYLTSTGWDCLRLDMFGYGLSVPSEEYLLKDPIPPVDHHEHVHMVAREYHMHRERLGNFLSMNKQFVVIGLSRGASTAIDFTLAYPKYVEGLVLCTGVVGGFDEPNKPSEQALFDLYDEFMAKKDVENATRMQIRVWGDGTQAKEGRLTNKKVREKLYWWCKDIAERELEGKGGWAIPCKDPGFPPPFRLLQTINAKAIVATGKYDESSTTEAMRHVAQNIKGAKIQEFKAAHMVNLECPKEFNEWVEAFLEQFTRDYKSSDASKAR